MRFLSGKKAMLGLILAALFMVSCGGPKPILMRPGADIVKKVALVNVYGTTTLRHYGKNSISLLAGADSLSTAGNSSKRNTTENLVDYTIQNFDAEFGKINGWEVMPVAEVMAHKGYAQFLKGIMEQQGPIFSKTLKLDWSTGREMLILPEGGRVWDERRLLMALAQDLGVDAVAVVGLDLAYSDSIAFSGNGTAKGDVGVSLVMVNRMGDFVTHAWTPRSAMPQSKVSSRSRGRVSVRGRGRANVGRRGRPAVGRRGRSIGRVNRSAMRRGRKTSSIRVSGGRKAPSMGNYYTSNLRVPSDETMGMVVYQIKLGTSTTKAMTQSIQYGMGAIVNKINLELNPPAKK